MVASYNGTPKGGLSLTYDALSGRIVTKEEGWTFAGLTPKTWTYTYDAAGRLWEASDGVTTKVYEYDSNGNRLGAAVDAQDRVTSQTDGGITTTYTYDDHGNVVTRNRTGAPAQALTWDSEGSLKSVVQANTVSYLVDARGRRVGRKVNGTLDREWLYDGQLRIVGEVIPGATPRYRLFGYLPERHLPVMMTETVSGVTKTYRIYGDHLGSLRAVVESATGNVVQVMQHGPWGEVDVDTVMGPFVRVPFGFAGGNYDEHTGLVRFGAREYDSGTGRWLSKDEARFGGGWNFYQYAAGDPVNFVDRTGRSPSAGAHDGWQFNSDLLGNAAAAAGAAFSCACDAVAGAAAAVTGAAMATAAVGAAAIGGIVVGIVAENDGTDPTGTVAPVPGWGPVPLAPPVACADNVEVGEDAPTLGEAAQNECKGHPLMSRIRGQCCAFMCGYVPSAPTPEALACMAKCASQPSPRYPDRSPYR